MRLTSPCHIAPLLLTVLCCGLLPRSSLCWYSWRNEVKKREMVLLCNASELFVEWNVTFSALQKRAVKVNVTAQHILQNIKFYKNQETVKANADSAIEKVSTVIRNTTRALVASRGFMDGIERDFFNAFEAIKDYPNWYVYGHSNKNDVDGRRKNEVLALFKNITKMYAECKNKFVANEHVSVESLERKVMAEVDNVSTNLTAWEEKQRTGWNATLTTVKPILNEMRGYDPYLIAMNVWHHDTTFLKTILKDCWRVRWNSQGWSWVYNIIESSGRNVLRHVTDVRDKALLNNSIEENECGELKAIFNVNTTNSSLGYKGTVNEEPIRKICTQVLENKDKYKCNVNRTSWQWIEERYKSAVPEVIERLNMSLIQLRDAEKRVTGLLGELFVQKREVYCNVTRAMNELNTSFMFAMKKNIDFVSEINTARSTITAAGADARKALDKSRLAFGDASKAKDITSTVADQLKQAQDANEKTKQLADEVETLEKMNEATLKKVEAERSKMAELKKELESAVSLERVRVNSIGGNFIQAVEIVKNSGNEVAAELCRKGTFAPPNVMIEDAFDVIERLVVISPFGSFNETNSLLQQYTLGTAALGLSVEELMKRGNEANKRALEALASAEEGERHSYRAKEIATNVVKGEMNAKRKELCTAEATLTENTQELEKLKAQESYLFKNITLMDVLLKKIVVNATTGSANCSGIAAVVKEAAKTALEVGGDAEQAAELTSAYCARVFSNVSAHEKKAKKVTAKIVSMKQNTDQVHSAAQISLDKSRSELNKMKKSFSGLLQYVEGHEIMPVNGECSEPDKFNTIHISFENATAIYSKIRDIGTFNGASVSGNLSVSRNAVSRAAEQLGIATQNARVMEEQTARIYQHVEVVDANARATLKRALGKQRSGLCDTLMRLMEMNRNASALREKMAVSRKSVVTHWHRAMKSQGDAKSVVARDANAAPHISSALTESQRTIDAVKRTRMTSRRMMKNATAVIKANEERMKHINKTFANTTKTVSAQSCNSDADVCHVSDLCNITSNLEISLHEINKLTDLMNITAAAGWLEGLMLESESVEMLLKEADKHASAAESAAQKAMEAGGCVPLDVQLLHMINDKS